jgi:hypothetical protein
MGFDIKAHIEVKIDKQWHHYSCPSILRNYELMDFLGAENLYHYNRFKAKGLPEDISVVTRIAYNKDTTNLFNPSWLTPDELKIVSSKFPQLDPFNIMRGNELGYLFDNSVERFYQYREDYPQEIEDVRMVFWFK